LMVKIAGSTDGGLVSVGSSAATNAIGRIN